MAPLPFASFDFHFQVLSEYYSSCSNSIHNEDKLLSKFNKKIARNPNFKLHKERVKLIG